MRCHDRHRLELTLQVQWHPETLDPAYMDDRAVKTVSIVMLPGRGYWPKLSQGKLGSSDTWEHQLIRSERMFRVKRYLDPINVSHIPRASLREMSLTLQTKKLFVLLRLTDWVLRLICRYFRLD